VLKVFVTQIKHVVVEDTPLILVVLKDIEPESRIEAERKGAAERAE
jgi:hypothetical protein